jgi:hypothetical protein
VCGQFFTGIAQVSVGGVDTLDYDQLVHHVQGGHQKYLLFEPND